MDTDTDKIIREHLIWLLEGGNAHMSFDEAVEYFPPEKIDVIFPNGIYSAWGLLEHIRRTQADILEFIKSPDYKEKEWPKDYWPEDRETAIEEDWQKTISAIKENLEELKKIVNDPKTDLYKEIPWGQGQTILREILLVCDHNSYEIGEFAIMRQVMGTWDKDHSE